MALVASLHDPNFAFVREGHYDGVYFYAVAIDPLAIGLPNRLIDYPAYRYGHPGYGWLAWLASAGQPRGVPAALVGLGLIGFGVAAFMGSLLAREAGWTPWGGLAVAFNPGFIYAVSVDTSETVGAALVLAGLWLWFKDRIVVAAVLFGFSCFVKEIFILIPAGLFLWEILLSPQQGRHGFSRERVGLLLAIPFPLLLWWFYLYAAFEVFPFLNSPEALAPPFLGWNDALAIAVRLGNSTFDETQVGAASLPILLATAALLVTATVRSFALRTPVHAIFLCFAALVACLSWRSLVYPKDMMRNLAVPLLFTPAILAPQNVDRERKHPIHGTR